MCLPERLTHQLRHGCALMGKQLQAASCIVQDVQPTVSLETVFFKTIGQPERING